MTEYRSLPSLERLNELLEVVEIPDDQLGIRSGLKWRIKRPGPRKKGDVAGCLVKNRRGGRSEWLVGIDNNVYLVARIVYYMVNKEKIDNLEIDHINRNTLDNNQTNLRIADRRIQAHNRTQKSSNTSGATGVTWHDQKMKWRARYSDKGLRTSLGLFICKKDAAEAYNQAIISKNLNTEYNKPLNDLSKVTCTCCNCIKAP